MPAVTVRAALVAPWLGVLGHAWASHDTPPDHPPARQDRSGKLHGSRNPFGVPI
jgi:hypothetical protein